MGPTQRCLASVLTLLRWLGMLPVAVKNDNITFRWRSFRVYFCLFLIVMHAMALKSITLQPPLPYLLTVFIAAIIVTMLVCLLVARNYKEFVMRCEEIDNYMKSYGFPKYLKLKSQTVCVILVTGAFATFWMFDVSSENNDTIISAVKDFHLNTSFTEVCKTLASAVPAAVRLQDTVGRSCVDALIISVGMLLAARLRQIATRTQELIEYNIQNINIWMELREDYHHFHVFCRKLDDIIGYLIICSNVSNVYFILVMTREMFLINVAIPSIRNISIIFGLIFHLFRCLAVCLFAGGVQAEGVKFVRCLILAPPHICNAETDRLLMELRQNPPALTGKQFFIVKHSLILQILGGIAANALILMPSAHSAV